MALTISGAFSVTPLMPKNQQLKLPSEMLAHRLYEVTPLMPKNQQLKHESDGEVWAGIEVTPLMPKNQQLKLAEVVQDLPATVKLHL